MPAEPPLLPPPPIRDPAAWPALAPPLALIGLGLLFILLPRPGAALFGLPLPEGPAGAAAWLAVVGLRDLVFGGYALLLALLSTARAVGLVLALTVLIPLGDIAILLAVRGLDAPGHLLLHLASGCVLAAAAAWMLRRA